LINATKSKARWFKNISSVMSLKRKAEDENLADQPPNKIQKLEDEDDYSDEEYDSDKSRSGEDFYEYHISDLLAPHERYTISKDPYNTTLMTEVYGNDFTLQREKDRHPLQTSSAVLPLPMDVLVQMLKYCDEVTIFTLSMTSKASTSTMFWKNLFYASRWRLPHELKNFNFNRDSKVYTSDIKNDIDWFGEYKRNCLNAKHIRELMQEISTKIYSIMDEYGASWDNENDKSLFYSGLSDDELDSWERQHNYELTNDLRQLFKYCNGAKFRMVDLEGERLTLDWWLHVPDFMLPKLEDVTINDEISVKNVVYNYYFGDTIDEDEHFDDSILLTEQDPLKFPELHDPQLAAFTERDLESDDEFNEISADEKTKSDLFPVPKSEEGSLPTEDQRSSELSSIDSENSSENSGNEEKADCRLDILLNFGQCRDNTRPDDDWTNEAGTYELLYEPITGYICTIMRLEPDKEVVFESNYRSIIEWLQEISDHLDDVRAHYFVVPKSKDDAAFTILAKIDQDMDFDVGEIWEKFWWSRMNAELLSGMIRSWEYGRPLYTPPRCDKMIAAAGQDFLVKLFQRANQLETEDYLRSETLTKAAKELGLFQYESITASYPAEAKEKKVDL
jgi:hypothetical protein